MTGRMVLLASVFVLAAGIGRADTYYLKGSDGLYCSSMSGAGSGTDGFGGWTNATGRAANSAENSQDDYVVDGGYMLRTPDANIDYAFKGKSLTFVNGSLANKLYNGHKLTVDNLIVGGTLKVSTIAENAFPVLAGKSWRVSESGTLTFSTRYTSSEDVRNLTVSAAVVGSGTLVATGEGVDGTGESVLTVSGDLSGFAGRLVVRRTEAARYSAVLTSGSQWLADPAALDAQGVVITNGATLRFGRSVVSGATRGFFFGGASDGGGRISVDLGKTVTILGPISGAGFTKAGPGRLILKDTAGFDTGKVSVAAGVVELPDGTELLPQGYSGAVKVRMVNELIREKGGRDAVLAAAAAVPALGTNGRWADLDYVTDKGSNWDPREHVSRCETLAAAIAVGAPEASAYADTIKAAMTSWYANVPKSSNWWYEMIGIPGPVGHTAVLAESAICEDPVYAKMVANLAVRKDHANAQTGMNLLWVRGIRFIYGLLTLDPGEMADDAAVMGSTIAVVSSGEGIQTDWCFHQHGAQPQIGNYGSQFLSGQVFWSNVFAGESYGYSQAQRDILTGMVENCFEWSLWKGGLEPGAMGRQIDDSVYLKGGRIADAVAASGRTLGDPRGYRYFDKSAYSIYRTDGWMASVKMGTSTIISSESTNGDNIYGWYLGDGAIWTLVTGREYEKVHALWDDWRMVPGVTQFRGVPTPAFGDKVKYRKPTATASGDGSALRTTFAYGPEEGLSYTKTWSFRPNGYDVRVANVTVTSSAPAGRSDVATCIENANACDGDAGMVTQTPTYSVYHNGAVYYVIFAAPERISFVLEDREGDQHDYTTSLPVGTMVSGRIFQLLVSHGKSPSNDTLAYSVRIGGWDKEEFDPSPRSISLAGERRLSDGRRELTLAFSPTKAAWSNALLVAYGATDGGDDLGAWETLELVAELVPPETTSLVWTSPASFGTARTYARFFFVDPDLAQLADYRVYDALKGDGTAYIDTGLVFRKGDWADLVFKYASYDSTHTSNGLFGYRVKSSGKNEMVEVNVSGGNFWMQYWDGAKTQIKVLRDYSGNPADFKENRWYTAHLGPDKRTLVREDGVTCAGAMDGDKKTSQYAETPYAGADFETPRNMYLFWISGNDVEGSGKDNSPPAAANFPIRSLKTYDGANNPTRDYVAVRRVSDGAFGMYDRIWKKFYGNDAAAGSFTGSGPTDAYVGLDLTRAQTVGAPLRYCSSRGLVIEFR